MTVVRSSREIAQRVDTHFHERRNRFRFWTWTIALLTGLLAGAWLAAMQVAGGRASIQNAGFFPLWGQIAFFQIVRVDYWEKGNFLEGISRKYRILVDFRKKKWDFPEKRVEESHQIPPGSVFGSHQVPPGSLDHEWSKRTEKTRFPSLVSQKGFYKNINFFCEKVRFFEKDPFFFAGFPAGRQICRGAVTGHL